jgi:hypothetical protein
MREGEGMREAKSYIKKDDLHGFSGFTYNTTCNIHIFSKITLYSDFIQEIYQRADF